MWPPPSCLRRAAITPPRSATSPGPSASPWARSTRTSPPRGEILLTAYAQGVERVIKAVDDATATADEPWERLEAACRAHLDLLLYAGGLAQVVVRVQPDDVPDAAADLVALRDRYEQRFRAIVSELDLAPHVDRRLFRLTLMGALNWSKTWYRSGGTDTATIARQIVETLRHGATTPQAAP